MEHVPGLLPFRVTVRATDYDGTESYTTELGETLEDARRKAALHGVAYFLYDNKYETGEHAAKIAAKAKDRLVEDGIAKESGFTFEFVPTPELAAA